MFEFFKNKPSRRFSKELANSFLHGFSIPVELLNFINWLEDENQTYEYRSSKEMFLPTVPVKDMDHLWSHLAFVIETDLVRHWFGVEGLESEIIPIVRCGADGSYFAIWVQPNKTLSYVFLGSEGECFTVANSSIDFITILTMGYDSIEDKSAISLSPRANWEMNSDEPWPDVARATKWLKKTYNINHPEIGLELLPFISEGDPFIKFVEETCG